MEINAEKSACDLMDNVREIAHILIGKRGQ